MITKKQCFVAEESAYHAGRFIIRPIYDNFYLSGATDSFNLIMARLMGLSYAQYLRFCRDMCGAELYGKNTKFPIPLFQNDERFKELVKLLNNKANLVLWERENPDWQEHQQKLAQWEKIRNTHRAHTTEA